MDVASGKAAADDYATAIYSQLLSLQEAREPIEVVTSRRRYVNMLIESLGVEHNLASSGALFVTVKLREVIVAQTRVTSLPPYAPAAEGKDGRQAEPGHEVAQARPRHSTARGPRPRRRP